MNSILSEIYKKFSISENELKNLLNDKSNKLKPILERYNEDINLKYDYLNNNSVENHYLINIYENFHFFKQSTIESNLSHYPKIIPKKKNFLDNLAKNINEFKLRFDKITNNQLKNIDWKGKKFVVAGGIVNAAFTGCYENCDNSDIDIFILNQADEEEFKNTIENIYNSLNYNKIIYKTSTTINILGPKPHRTIQIPLKLTKDITQLLLFFDLDCASIAYDGENLFALPRFFDCLNTGFNTLDIYKINKKIYLNRIKKYYKRGYGFLISTFDGTKITKDEINNIKNKLSGMNILIEYNENIIENNELYKREHYVYPEIMSYRVPKNIPQYIEDIDSNENIYLEIRKCLLGDIINYKWNDKTLLIKENIIRCYMCKKYIEYNKNCMCENCFAINMTKRNNKKNLEGQLAIVTGARVKIGYYTSLKLLRCGAKVIATTRFPNDALNRYSREIDFNNWKNNLLIYAIDFRHLPSVNKFIEYVVTNYNRLDILINNAAQTVKRPPEFYEHLIEGERSINDSMIKCDYFGNNSNHLIEYNISHSNLIHEKNDMDLSSIPLSVALSMNYIGDEKHELKECFPKDKYDNDGQQIDLRKNNSWNSKMDDISMIELIEVQVINSIVPSLLVSKLKKLMQNNHSNSKHIINVQSPEGMFSINKSSDHPHTNMAKAALNQLTQTIANEFIKDNIYVNSVDVGWTSSCLPTFITPPLSYEDSVARILDPVFTEKYYGKLLKDFRICQW